VLVTFIVHYADTVMLRKYLVVLVTANGKWP
jgi:hypothetical protein